MSIKSNEIQQTQGKGIEAVNVQQRDREEKRDADIRLDKEEPTPKNGL